MNEWAGCMHDDLHDCGQVSVDTSDQGRELVFLSKVLEDFRLL